MELKIKLEKKDGEKDYHEACNLESFYISERNKFGELLKINFSIISSVEFC